jgi:gliding motility-associated protein GldL
MAAAIPPKVSRVVDIFVSIAAAVVIWGALQKLLHTSSADFFLKLGLGTEALVFLVYGILYLIYPAVDDHQVKIAGAQPQQIGNPALRSMEKMLEEADITPANLGKLSAGFQKLGTTVEKMGEISDVVKATGDYTQKTNEAAKALDAVKVAYSNAANSATSFNNSSDAAASGAKVFHEQIQVLTKNLSSLNTIYELELQESNNHLKALNQFYGKLNEASNAMNTTASDAIRAKDQISALANNLGKLNQIYGNMISAMQGGKA